MRQRMLAGYDRIASLPAGVHGRPDSQFRDGRSFTTALAEKLTGDRNPAHFTPWCDLLCVNTGNIGLNTLNDADRGCSQPTPPQSKHYSFASSTWVLAGFSQTCFNHILTPNSEISDCVDGAPDFPGVFTARSLHRGGVNVLYADGSVRFANNSIDLDVWRALGTIAGNETISQE